jgi:hypothetical protein
MREPGIPDPLKYDWIEDPRGLMNHFKVKSGELVMRPPNRCFHCARRFVGSTIKVLAFCSECDLKQHVGGEEDFVNYNPSIICRVPVPFDYDNKLSDSYIDKIDIRDIAKCANSLFGDKPETDFTHGITFDQFIGWRENKEKARAEFHKQTSSIKVEDPSQLKLVPNNEMLTEDQRERMANSNRELNKSFYRNKPNFNRADTIE